MYKRKDERKDGKEWEKGKHPQTLIFSLSFSIQSLLILILQIYIFVFSIYTIFSLQFSLELESLSLLSFKLLPSNATVIMVHTKFFNKV